MRNGLEASVLAHELSDAEGFGHRQGSLLTAAELHVVSLREQLAASFAEGGGGGGGGGGGVVVVEQSAAAAAAAAPQRAARLRESTREAADLRAASCASGKAAARRPRRRCRERRCATRRERGSRVIADADAAIRVVMDAELEALDQLTERITNEMRSQRSGRIAASNGGGGGGGGGTSAVEAFKFLTLGVPPAWPLSDGRARRPPKRRAVHREPQGARRPRPAAHGRAAPAACEPRPELARRGHRVRRAIVRAADPLVTAASEDGNDPSARR